MDDEGFEPSTFRMQNGRSTTELNALWLRSMQHTFCGLCAALAQLGERQTEDLKVPGSIPGGGTFWQAGPIGPVERRRFPKPESEGSIPSWDEAPMV